MKLSILCMILLGIKLAECVRRLHRASVRGQYGMKAHRRFDDIDLYTTDTPPIVTSVGLLSDDNNAGNNEPQEEPNCPSTKPPDELQKLKEQLQNLQEELDQTKKQLLRKTREAAKAFEIAKSAKKEIVSLLEYFLQEASEEKNREISSLEQDEMACGDVMRSLRDIQATVELLRRAIHLADVLRSNAAHSAEGVHERYQLMQKQLEVDRDREEHLKKRLEESKNELECTKDSAENARTAAQVAKQNTRRDQRKIINVEILGTVQ